MTIITKPKTEKSSQKLPQKPRVININDEGGFVDIIGPGQEHGSEQNVEMWLSPSARRRISTTTTVCVFMTALLVMSIGIIGGVYLYRQVTQHQKMARFKGWCGVPYEKNSLSFNTREPWRLKRPVLRDDHGLKHLFKEEFDLDLATESYEEIRVPDFGYGRKGVFIHDFKVNKTVIIDISGKRCFVMPLDSKHVKPPRRLFELIYGMWMGYYNVNTKVIRRRMKVVHPPIKDLSAQGDHIAKSCSNYTTYLLEEKSALDRIRRSITGDKESNLVEFTLAEFAGENIVEFTIVDSKE